MISYVYANRRRKKYATKSIRDPTRAGGGVFQSTSLMFLYQRGALSGSAAYRATSSTGRLMTTVFETSTFMPKTLHACQNRRRRVEAFGSAKAQTTWQSWMTSA